jgi:hypothetical protein
MFHRGLVSHRKLPLQITPSPRTKLSRTACSPPLDSQLNGSPPARAAVRRFPAPDPPPQRFPQIIVLLPTAKSTGYPCYVQRATTDQ